MNTFEAALAHFSDILTQFEDKEWRDVPPNAHIQIREAAVLVPVIWREDSLSVLLTQRTASLRHHSGQVSFPGGKIEACDASPEAAALREAFEEIHLSPDWPNIVGRMPNYVTLSGFNITPILALMHPPLNLRADPSEVASVFELPFSFLLAEENFSKAFYVYEHSTRWYWQGVYEGYRIWGATAWMLKQLGHAYLR